MNDYLNDMNNILIYGAYGYAGRLIVEELLKRGIKPAIAGRDAEKLSSFAAIHGLDYEVLEVSSRYKLERWLSTGHVVIHCGGPFIHTAKEMVQGCLATGTHYLDISGEFQVIDLIKEYGEKAKQKGCMLMPGVGFDVVPSDCLAKHLSEALPSASELQLAFVNKGGRLSRGTARTMIENMGEPQTRRVNGDYEVLPLGKSAREVDYGDFQQLSMGISWGDIATAFYSTGIPTIEVFSGTTQQHLMKVRKTLRLSFMLRSHSVKKILMRQIDKRPDGPDEKSRSKSNMYLWGMASDGKEQVEARLKTPNAYSLTALTAATIAQKICSGDFHVGFQTPSLAYGKGLILEIDGCEFLHSKAVN